MITALTKLKRATHRNKVYGKAPHKVVLLLAVVEQIEAGNITDNKIYITADLVAAFQKIWLKLVPLEYLTKTLSVIESNHRVKLIFTVAQLMHRFVGVKVDRKNQQFQIG